VNGIMATAAAKTPEIGNNRSPLITADQLAEEFAHVEKAIAEIEAAAKAAPPVLEDDEDIEVVNGFAPKLRGALKRIKELHEDRKEPFLDAGRVVDRFFKSGGKSFADRINAVQTDLENRATIFLRKKADAERKKREIEEQRLREDAARKAAEAADAVRAGNRAEAELAQSAATAAINRADNAARSAAAPVSDLSRTETGAGAAELDDNYEFRITDRSQIDFAALAPYFGPKDIEDAIKRFVKQGGRTLRGVAITHAPKAKLGR
jgi:hypothetical protein